MKKLLTILGTTIGVFCILFLSFYINNQRNEKALGSVPAIADGYYSTTTDSTFCSIPGNSKLLKGGSGLLGSIIVNSGSLTSSGGFKLYDATSTATTSIAGAASAPPYATSTLAAVASSTPGGTYVYDVSFSRGLIMDMANGSACPATSTTITWK